MADRRFVSYASTLVFAISIVSAAPLQRGLSSYDRGLSLSMLKLEKEDLRKNYYDPSFRGFDIDKISHWFDHDVKISVDKTRKGDVVDMAHRRKDAFTGRIVALIDSESASASEVTARVLQLEKRGIVLGDRSAGAVMTSRFFPHTLGGELGGVVSVAYWGTSITVGDVRMSDGQSLEKVGVTPDEVILPTAADLAANRDPVLARAITLLGGSMTPEQAGAFYR